MEESKSEKKERSKSRERSHSKSPRAKLKSGEASTEKQQADSRKDGKRTRGEARKLYYRRVPSPIHAPSDEETPVEFLKRKNKSSNQLTVESASEKKRRGRPPKSKKEELTTKLETKHKGGRNSRQRTKDLSTIKVMSEKFNKGNLPPERQKSLADELLGSVSEDSSSDDEPLISKRVKSPVHSPEDSPKARLIPSPVPKIKRPPTVNEAEKNMSNRGQGNSSRNKPKKSLPDAQKGLPVIRVQDSSGKEERVEFNPLKIYKGNEDRNGLQVEHEHIAMPTITQTASAKGKTNTSREKKRSDSGTDTKEMSTDDDNRAIVTNNPPLNRQLSEKEKKILAKITESDSDVDMDEDVIQRKKSPVRAAKDHKDQKPEDEKLKKDETQGKGEISELSSDQDEEKCERIDEPPQSPSPPVKLKPSTESAPTNELQGEQKSKSVDVAKEAPDDHHDADNEESDESEDESRIERMQAPPRSPSPPPFDTRPVTPQTEHRDFPTEKLERRKESEVEESSSDTESQHAKLVSPPRSPSPIRSASETDKEVEITTALIPKSSADLAKIDEDVFSAKEAPVAKELEQDNGKEDGTESCDTDVESEERNHLEMASPPKSPSFASCAETEPMEAFDQGMANRKSRAGKDGKDFKEGENVTPENLTPEDHSKPREATTEDESSDDDEIERKVTRLASPPRSPSPIRSPSGTSKSPKVDKASMKEIEANSEDEQKGDSSDEDESSEDEEENERKRAARMVSPPRSPSPIRSQESEQTSGTMPSDIAACLPYTEAQKNHLQSSDGNDSEEDDLGHKQIRSTYPQRSPSPMRSSEVESTNSTVREVMLETSDEKDNLSVQDFSEQEESSEGEEVEETVARLSSPPRSPSPIRSPGECNTASEPASQEQEMDDSDEGSEEDVRNDYKFVSVSPPRSPSPQPESNMPQGELDTEEKHGSTSSEESSEDEEETGRISRTRLPPRSPSVNLSPEVEHAAETPRAFDKQPGLDVYAESSSEDETDEDEAVNETIKMSSPPGSPEPEIDPTGEDVNMSSKRELRETDSNTNEAFVEQTENLKLQLSEDESIAEEENEARGKTSKS